MTEQTEDSQTDAFTPDALSRSLEEILHAIDANAASWHGQLAAAKDAVQEEEGVASIEDVKWRLETWDMNGTSGKRDPLEDIFAKRYAPILDHMTAGMTNISHGLRSLSAMSARAATQFDPDGPRRILDRMHTLGDTVLRQIEGRLAATDSRGERKLLQDLRDEMWKWLDERDARIHEARLAVEDLAARANALRCESLSQAGRLAQASDLAGEAAGPMTAGRVDDVRGHAKPEAASFASSLRAFVLGARANIAAPLQEG